MGDTGLRNGFWIELARYLLGGVIMVAGFALAAAAQSVTVANHSQAPFAGWVRTTVDVRPPHDSGTGYALGRQIGLDLWAIDVQVSLAPREVKTIDIGAQAAVTPRAVPLPGDPLGHFGGLPALNGSLMSLVGLQVDGVTWTLHCRSRTGRLGVVDAWLSWRPSEPALVFGEATYTASNPAVPDVQETLADDVRLSWGDGVVWNSVLVRKGERFADGQARTLPVVMCWPRHVTGTAAWVQIAAAVHGTTRAVGVRELWLGQGNPRLQTGLDPVTWTSSRLPQALASATTFGDAVTGPNKNSADSGAQGDQVFVAGECMVQPGPELVHLYSAYKLAARPCHYRRADGSPLDPSEKPGVQFWQGRPHGSTGDLLGKASGISAEMASGWWGPDDEHWLYNGLAVTARVTGSRALQAELSQQARLFLWAQPLPGPGREQWVTVGPGAARAVGWVCLLANHLWANLEDRALASRVRDRMVQRITQVYVPAFQGKDWWDVRVDDDRLGPGARWIPWQQAVGAYGLDVVSERFGVAAGRAVALRAATAVMRDAWVKVGNRWQSRPSGVPASVAPGGPSDESFNLFGMCLAPATILRQQPSNAQAGSVWAQLLVDADLPHEVAWLPPEVKPAPAGVTSVGYGDFTWTFSAPVQAGTFCTGEPWVVGPVTVTSVFPLPVDARPQGGRFRNGSMLNPSASCSNGYHSDSFFNYNDGKFRDELSIDFPVTIATGSLVSTWGDIASGSNDPDARGQVGFLKDAAVLTVLDEPPPADAFRPPYVGTSKAIPGTLSQVNWTALASLPAAPGMPDLAVLRERLSHLWLDHCPEWVSRYLHPRAGLSDYYRGFTTEIGTAALAVNCAGLDETVRRELTVRLVQIGIDNFAVMQNGARWGVNGHCNGRKFPILFAGKMLGRADMLAAGTTYRTIFNGPFAAGNNTAPFSEDGQTFYVQETSPGVFNWGFGGYTAADVGIAEWGNFHTVTDGLSDPNRTGNIRGDTRDWYGGLGYRVCCSANGWPGQTLAMRIMGLREAWNQPAYFDYVDRYMQVMRNAPAGEQWQRAWEPWHAAMWDAYRGSF